MIETSIIFIHYSEDKTRDVTAKACLETVARQKNDTTELVLVLNGIYPYRDEFIKYADQWNERDVDPSPGRGFNIGYKMAKGNYIFWMANDVLLKDGAVAECVRLIKKYPQFLVTPVYPPKWKQRSNYSLIDGFMGNKRAGDMAGCMTRDQINDIGPHIEEYVWKDEVEYINRRIQKGYTVLLTKEPMGFDMAPNVRSFVGQLDKFNITDKNVRRYVYGS